MIISVSTDYHTAAQRKPPSFLFRYIDGGAYTEYTLRRNVEGLSAIALRQRVPKNMSKLNLETRLFGKTLAMPVTLAPIGLTGIYAHRGEVQAARAAAAKSAPFTLSTISVCPIEEVAPATDQPMWFQLYMLKDRGFMHSALERAKAAGVATLVFTIDIPALGTRYRNTHSGMDGPYAASRRTLQAMTHPAWVWDVGLLGKPHDFGNISAYRGNPIGLEDYISWLGTNFDPLTSWKDLERTREFWDDPMVIKGILDPEDTRDVVKLDTDGIIVSNHGGHQLDGVLSSTCALSVIVDAAEGELTILTDSGIRTGLDVVRMIALGTDSVLLGRAFVYALAAVDEAEMHSLLELIEKEICTAMVPIGAKSIGRINADSPIRELGA